MNIEKIEAKLIILILFCAILNDILRIPNSKITLFRVLIPVAVILIVKHIYELKNLIIVFISIYFIMIFQNYLYYCVFEFEAKPDYAWIAEYFFYYTCIMIIFALMKILRNVSDLEFERLFTVYPRFISIMCIILYVLSVKRIPSYIDNQNNYACALAIVFPWLIIFAKKWRSNWILAAVILVELWWGDSQSVFMGVVIEIGLLLLIFIIKKCKGTRLILVLIPAFIAFIAVFILCFNITMNGYNIRDIAVGMTSHVLTGTLYPDSPTSVYYRTNSIIHMLNTIKRSWGFGVGAGNASRLLGQLMPNVARIKGVQYLSPHNCVLEMIAEFGYLAIAIFISILTKGIKHFINAKDANDAEIYAATILISFFVWSMSASGVLTIYLLPISFSWLWENRYRIKGDELS